MTRTKSITQREQAAPGMASVPETRAIFRPEGEFWTIAFGTELSRLRDSVGLRYLAVLLGRPGLRVLAADLVLLAGPESTSLPPDRERARARVTHAIRSAMRRVARHHVALSEHLRATIITGTRCAYLPDPRRPFEWEL